MADMGAFCRRIPIKLGRYAPQRTTGVVAGDPIAAFTVLEEWRAFGVEQLQTLDVERRLVAREP